MSATAILAASSHVDRRTAESADIDGSPADVGYIEFLRFLQSPTLGIDHNDKCHPDWEAETRETSGNGKELDLATTLEEEDTDDESMYIGPGEIGFYYSKSIHESDISETDSEFEELDEDANNSTDTHEPIRSVIVTEEPQNSSGYDNEDARSTTTSDGYSEFLRFLAAPTIPLSVNDADTVLVDDKESDSVDSGYEEFLIFLQSLPRVEPLKLEDATVVARSPSPVNHLEESKIEDVREKSRILEQPDEPKAEEVFAKSSRPGKLAGYTEKEQVYSRMPPENVMRELDMKEGYLDSSILAINHVNDYNVSKQELIKSKPTEEPWEETKVDEGQGQSLISNICIVDTDNSSTNLVKTFGKSSFNEGSLQPIGPIVFWGGSCIRKNSMPSHSSISFLDDVPSSHSGEELVMSLSLSKPLKGTESANVFDQPASPIIVLEDFSDRINEETESQISTFPKRHSTAFILGTMLFSIAFHICQFRIEAGIAEVVMWFQLMAPYALNLSK
ncbi:hypothetical protein ACHAW6_009545 [Cyclotella cf. meneghiniana]